MRNKFWFFLGLIVLIIVFIISGLGFYLTQKNTKKPEKPKIIEAPEESSQPIFLQKENKILPTLPPVEKKEETETTSLEENIFQGEEVKALFEKELAFGGFVYPYLYVYDPDDGILKYLNLEDKTYKELYKAYYLTHISVSPNRKRILFQENNKWKILDLGFDQVKNIDFNIKSFFWLKDDLYFFAFDNFKGGGLYKVSDFQKEPQLIKNLHLPDVKLKIFNNLILVYLHPLVNKNSYVFSLNLKNPNNWQIYLDEKDYYSLLPSSNNKYLYLSYLENNNWVSKIFDQNKKEVKFFNWGTFDEKCTFDEILVCGVPLNVLENLDSWYKLKRNFNDKIIIFNPKTDELKEINLKGFFDVIQPKLTPLGIIFLNRNDSKFYIVNFK